jgi:hypothetical protein
MTQPSPITPQIPAQSKSWLARKWKLLVGLLVVLLVLGIAVVFGIISLVMSSIKGSDVATEAMARARSNPTVVQHLGLPIGEGWLVSGSINVSTGSGDADLSLPISGPKGKGTIYVTAQKSGGVWRYTLMQAAIAGTAEKIDLLSPSTTQPSTTTAATPVPNLATETAAVTSSPAATAPPPVAPTTQGLGTADGEQTGTRIVITDLNRGVSTLTLKFTIYNDSNAELDTGMRFKSDGYKENGGRSFSGIHLLDGVSKKKYFVVADSDGNCLCSEHVDDIRPKTQVSLWAKFPAPPENIQKITVEFPHFIPVDDVPIR